MDPSICFPSNVLGGSGSITYQTQSTCGRSISSSHISQHQQFQLDLDCGGRRGRTRRLFGTRMDLLQVDDGMAFNVCWVKRIIPLTCFIFYVWSFIFFLFHLVLFAFSFYSAFIAISLFVLVLSPLIVYLLHFLLFLPCWPSLFYHAGQKWLEIPGRKLGKSVRGLLKETGCTKWNNKGF